MANARGQSRFLLSRVCDGAEEFRRARGQALISKGFSYSSAPLDRFHSGPTRNSPEASCDCRQTDSPGQVPQPGDRPDDKMVRRMRVACELPFEQSGFGSHGTGPR